MSTAIAAARYAVTRVEGFETYRIGSEATITLQPATGYIAIHCTHHAELNGCHYWSARGDKSLKQFLLQLSKDYTLGKLFEHNACEEFDLEASRRTAKRHILQLRRDGVLTTDDARDLYNEAGEVETAEGIANLSYDESYYDICNREKSCATWFWDHVWQAFTDHLRKEIA